MSASLAVRPYILPQLHIQPLDGKHTLLFNPLGPAGVIILNQPTLQLLESFRRPLTIQQGAAEAGNPPGAAEAIHKLIRLALLQPAGTIPVPHRDQPQTITAWLHVTNACNLRCPYCYLHKTPEAMEIAHGRQAIDAIFRSAVLHQFKRVKIKYAGGEATLNIQTVLALHQYAAELAGRHALALEGVILSNGVAYGPKLIEAIQSSGLRLMISLDGIGVAHDAQRPLLNGGGSFARVERSLNALQAAGLTPSISITITNQNLAGLAETVSYVLARRLPFSLNFYRENECATAFTDLAYSQEQIIAAMHRAFAVIEASLPPYSLLNAVLDRTRLDTPHDRPCGVGQNYLVIDQHGRVAKCQMEIERSLTDVQAADPLGVIRADTIYLQNPAVEEKEGCRDCHWRYWCAGGCPALTYRATGRYDIKSPNCAIYRALFPAVLRLEGLRLLQYGRPAGGDKEITLNANNPAEKHVTDYSVCRPIGLHSDSHRL